MREECTTGDRTGRRRGSKAARTICVAALVSLALAPEAAKAAFPGQNGKIAFARSNFTFCSGEIFTVEPDGSGAAQLTNETHQALGPGWSADGDKLAFYKNCPGFEGIFTMSPDGTGQQRVTDGVVPNWSPDGRQLVFQNIGWIFVVNADGSGRTALTSPIDPNRDDDPVWSPDGRKIAFAHRNCRFDEGTVCDPADIYTINPDGTGLANVTNTPTKDEHHPDYSPDGRRFAFTAGLGSSAHGHIETMAIDGTDVRVVTSGTGDGRPSWSPDGTKIAFRRVNVGWDVWVANADGSGEFNLTNTTGLEESFPDWQPLVAAPPPPGAFKNAAQFCKAERERLGRAGFRAAYGRGAFGSCVRRFKASHR